MTENQDLNSSGWLEDYTIGIVQKVQNMRLSKRYKYPKFTCRDFNGEVDILRHTEELNNHTHCQDYLEMVYTRKGCAHFKIEDQTISVPEKSFLLVATLQPHTDNIEKDSEVYHILINTNTILKTFLNLMYEAPRLSAFFTNVLLDPQRTKYLLYQITQKNQLPVESCFEEILRVFSQKGPQYIPILKCQIALLLLLISSHCSYTGADDEEDSLSSKIFGYISSRYPKVTLKEVAEHFNYNPDYISRLLKRTYGGSFKQIVSKVRMEQAQILLSKTGLSIAEIARLVGYDETVSFQNTFKKAFGITPKQYRLQFNFSPDK